MSAVATAEERKYPRTVHLAFSPCVFSDDLQQTNSSVFEGEEVVITEKLDGGHCCIDVMDKKMTDFNGINNKQMTKLFDDMNTENDTKSTAQTQKTVENDDKMTEK